MKGLVNQPAVLILGAAPRIAVPIARLLRERCGVPVEVASLYPSEPPLRSRAIRGFVHLPDIHLSPAEFSEALLTLVRKKQIDTIIPIQDRALAAIAENYQHLAGVAHLACPPPHVIELALNKRSTLQIAEKCGIRVPRSFSVSTSADIEAIVGQLCLPIVVKPAETKYSAGLKARYFDSYEGLLSWARTHPDSGQYLVQEYCPGEGVGIEILMHDGVCTAMFQHRRLKEQPPSGGVAVMAVAESPDPVLAQASLRLLREMEWEGVAMVEFRRNPIDGTAALMEVNGRFWGTSALPLMAGLEFPVYQWQILHGQTPRVPPVYVVGMRWRWTAGYLIRTRRLFSPSSQEAGQVSRWNEFIKIPQDLSPTVRDAVWSVSDPMPGLQEVASTIWDLLKQDCRALLTKLAPARLSREVARFRRFPRVQRPVYLKVKLRNLVAGARDLKKRVPPGARSFVFVCHGNIMRSPLCEALFKRELGPQASDFRVVSAGLHAQEGRSVDPRALVAAREVGISLDGHKAQRLTSDMVQNADVILAMDLQNKVELLTAYPAARRKVFMISSYASPPSRENEIPDPYFGDIEQARSCCKLLFTCIRNLTASLFPERQAQHGVGARCEIEARGEMHSK